MKQLLLILIIVLAVSHLNAQSVEVHEVNSAQFDKLIKDQGGVLYQKHIKMSDKNCFFFPSSSSKNNYVAMAMKRFFASNKKKIIQFFYQSF